MNGLYYKLIKYYKKHWLNNPYINYIELDNKELLNRTNNYIENFHHLLNMTFDVYHPKLSYLIYKYKNYLIHLYIKIKDSLININDKSTEKFSVVNDIKEFLTNFNHKYKCNINFNFLLQDDENDKLIIFLIKFVL